MDEKAPREGRSSGILISNGMCFSASNSLTIWVSWIKNAGKFKGICVNCLV